MSSGIMCQKHTCSLFSCSPINSDSVCITFQFILYKREVTETLPCIYGLSADADSSAFATKLRPHPPPPPTQCTVSLSVQAYIRSQSLLCACDHPPRSTPPPIYMWPRLRETGRTSLQGWPSPLSQRPALDTVFLSLSLSQFRSNLRTILISRAGHSCVLGGAHTHTYTHTHTHTHTGLFLSVQDITTSSHSSNLSARAPFFALIHAGNTWRWDIHSINGSRWCDSKKIFFSFRSHRQYINSQNWIIFQRD